MTGNLYCINIDDNVVTALSTIGVGPYEIIGEINMDTLTIKEKIAQGHKVAIKYIVTGEDIIKYGVPIGYATRAILKGEWVHLHNIKSHFDERSSTLDPKTGLSTDIDYD
jgi:hypothetical protein